MKQERLALLILLVAVMLTSLTGTAQLVPGSMDVHWKEGASNCATSPQPPLQLHAYNQQTFIIREDLCSTFEAPFIYLLVGSKQALLIDTGDIADPNQMPLAKTVMRLLPGDGPSTRHLVVVHTHRHLDHRAGDAQFAHLPNVELTGYDLESVRNFYHFTDWPNGLAQIDLGDRIIDVIPTPGHSETEVSFFDRNTGLFFSGDFLMPARLLVDDTSAYLASAQRVAAFVKDRSVTYVLGGHIEKDTAGELFPWKSQFHPHEQVLQMTKDDLLALPTAIQSFNGFYTNTGRFVLMNSMRILITVTVIIAVILIALVWVVTRYIRRRIRSRRLQQAVRG